MQPVANYDPSTAPNPETPTTPAPDAETAGPFLVTATLAQQVYVRLRRDILSNAYPPSTPLPEEAVAGRLSEARPRRPA